MTTSQKRLLMITLKALLHGRMNIDVFLSLLGGFILLIIAGMSILLVEISN